MNVAEYEAWLKNLKANDEVLIVFRAGTKFETRTQATVIELKVREVVRTCDERHVVGTIGAQIMVMDHALIRRKRAFNMSDGRERGMNTGKHGAARLAPRDWK